MNILIILIVIILLVVEIITIYSYGYSSIIFTLKSSTMNSIESINLNLENENSVLHLLKKKYAADSSITECNWDDFWLLDSSYALK